MIIIVIIICLIIAKFRFDMKVKHMGIVLRALGLHFREDWGLFLEGVKGGHCWPTRNSRILEFKQGIQVRGAELRVFRFLSFCLWLFV